MFIWFLEKAHTLLLIELYSWRKVLNCDYGESPFLGQITYMLFMHELNLFHDNKKEPFVTKYCCHKNSDIYHQTTLTQLFFVNEKFILNVFLSFVDFFQSLIIVRVVWNKFNFIIFFRLLQPVKWFQMA